MVAGYGISFWMLALVLKELPIGLTYAVWAAVGTALIATIGDLRLRRAPASTAQARSASA